MTAKSMGMEKGRKKHKKKPCLYFVSNTPSVLFTLNIPIIPLREFLLVNEDSAGLGNITA